MDVEAHEARLPATAARLKGFELMQGLYALAMQMRFVPHDLVQTGAIRKNPRELGEGDTGGIRLGKYAFSSEPPLSIRIGNGEILPRCGHMPISNRNLVAIDAVKTPEEERHTVCEGFFQVAFRSEAGDDALMVATPITLVLHSVEHRAIRADGVNDSVAAGDGLTRTAFGTGALRVAVWGKFVWQKRVLSRRYVAFGIREIRPWADGRIVIL